MGEYDWARSLAVELIGQKGANVTLRKFTAGVTADPSKPWRKTANSHADSTVKCVLLPISHKRTNAYSNGTEVRTGDQVGYMTTAVAPDLGSMVIEADGTQWYVIDFERLAPDGNAILYTIYVRK